MNFESTPLEIDDRTADDFGATFKTQLRFFENNTTCLVDEIQTCLSRSSEISIAVAFVRASGVDLLLSSIRQAIDRGASIRLLFGLDFSLSEADAVRALLDVGVDARAYSSRESFHPKGYVFQVAEGFFAIVGSSNLSASGLTSGREWNVAFHPAEIIIDEFNRLWQSSAAIPVTDDVLERLERRPTPTELAEHLEKEDRVEDQQVNSLRSMELSLRAANRPARVAGPTFAFSINKSFKRYGQITVPRTQVSYDELVALGFGAGNLTIAFEDQRPLRGFMHSARAGFGPYYQIRISDQSSHPLFDVPIGTRVAIALERDAEGENFAQIARG